jgi:hypothetical protein
VTHVVPFDEEDESPFVGLLQVAAGLGFGSPHPAIQIEDDGRLVDYPL